MTAKYSFISSTHRTFIKRDRILGCRTSLDTVKRILVIQSMFLTTVELIKKSIITIFKYLKTVMHFKIALKAKKKSKGK